MEGYRKLYTGDFNTMHQEWQPDSSVIITLSKRGDDKIYHFRVRNLYGQNETVSEHQVIPVSVPQWLLDKMRKAREHGKP